jgi:hypothetical protein
MLTWVPASSADKDHDDVEADLSKLGRPGGGDWLLVAADWDRKRNREVWTWEVLDGWLYDEAEILANDSHDTRAEALLAAESWVRNQLDRV